MNPCTTKKFLYVMYTVNFNELWLTQSYACTRYQCSYVQSSVKRLKSFPTTYILVLAVDELDFDPLAAENRYELEKNTNVLKR